MSDPSTPADDGSAFDSGRLRGISSMRRSRDDRMVAGVCAGAARFLRIDPVVVRVLFASLALVGLAGVIVYVAVWVLIPEEGDERGLVDAHLPDGTDREQARRLGLFVAVAIAAASVLSSGFTFDWPGIPIVLVLLALFYFVVVLPYNRRRATREEAAQSVAYESTAAGPTDIPSTGDRAGSAGEPPGTPGSGPYEEPEPRPRNPRHDHGAMLGLTALACLAVTVAMGAYDAYVQDIAWPYYPLAALVVVAAGMTVGSFLGNGRPLVLLGLPLAVVLLATTVLPSYTMGDRNEAPVYAGDLEDSYTQGMGNFVLDLSRIRDPEELDARTVEVEQGLGSVEVIVPDGVDVDVDAHADAGAVRLFGDSVDGVPASRRYVSAPSDDPELRLELSQTAGEIKVGRE